MKTIRIIGQSLLETIRSYALVPLVLIVLAHATSASEGPGILDQVQPVASEVTMHWAVGGESHQMLAQVFTAGRSGRLTAVGLPIAGQGDLIVQLQAVAGEIPSGTVLIEQRVEGRSLPSFASDPSGFRNISFDTAFSVVAGQPYAIVMSVREPDAENSFGIRPAPDGDVYSRGEAYADALPNAAGWQPLVHPAHDLPFQVFVRPEVQAPQRPSEINFTIANAGRVSLAVYDSDGRQLRTLLAGEQRGAGPHTVLWDGVDREGHPAPPGQYTWKLLVNQGLEADFVTVLGINPESVSLETNPGPHPWTWWVGNHDGPTAVATAPNGFFVGSGGVEGVPSLIRLEADRRGHHWEIGSNEETSTNEGSGWGGGGPRALALVGTDLICLAAKGTAIFKRHADDGSLIASAFLNPDGSGSRTSYLNLLEDPGTLFRNRLATHVSDMDADPDRIVVSIRDLNQVRWYATTDGTPMKTNTVSTPGQVALGAGGAVYVISGNQILRLREDSDVSQVVIGDDLLWEPTALAYDRVTDELLVANGSRNWQIKRFTTEGSFLKAYGVAGGRPNGTFVRDAFKHVIDLAADSEGGAWVVEEGLRRVSHLNPSGAVDYERFGGAPFYSVASVTADHPNEVWMPMDNTTMICYQVLYNFNDGPDGHDTATWQIKSVHEVRSVPDSERWPLINISDVARVRHWGGKTFFVNEGITRVLRLDEETQEIVPAAKIGRTSDGTVVWSDSNGDGIELDLERHRISESVPFPQGGGNRMAFDTDLGIILGIDNSFPEYFRGRPFVHLPNQAPVGSPAPDWDLANPELPERWQNPLLLNAKAVRPGPAGDVFLFMGGSTARSTDIHPYSRVQGAANHARILRYSTRGHEWSVAKSISYGPALGAQVRSPSSLPGHVKECLIVGDRDDFGATAWTDDGLYAGFLFDRHRPVADVADDIPERLYHPDGLSDAAVPFPRGDDWDAGCQVLETAEGRVLMFVPGRNCVAIYRVRGWDNWHRASGTIQLERPPAAADGLGIGLRAEYFANPTFAGRPSAVRTNGMIWFLNNVGSYGRDEGDWSFGPGNWTNAPMPGFRAMDRVSGIGRNAAFSVRWTGRIVPPLSEPYWFRLYNAWFVQDNDQFQYFSMAGGFFRMRLNGKVILEHSREREVGLGEFGPTPLKAGESYDLELEYSFDPGEGSAPISPPQISLAWSSYSMDWTRIPKTQLYPDSRSGTSPRVSVSILEDRAREDVDHPIIARVSTETILEADLVVFYTLSGTANPNDYLPLSGQVVIPSGSREAEIPIRVFNDNAVEAEESLILSINVNDHYHLDGSPGTANLTIQDDDNILTSGLTAYYMFDEPNGTVVHDSSGQHLDGTLGAPAGISPMALSAWHPTDGQHGGTLVLTPSPVMVSISGLPRLLEYSIAFWIKTEIQHASIIHVRRGFRPPGTPEACDELQLSISSGRLRADLCGTVALCEMISDNRWHHVAYTYSPGADAIQTVYVDGFQCARLPVPGNQGLGSTLRVGGYTFVSDTRTYEAFGGGIDDLRIYDRSLAAEDIRQLADLPSRPRDSGFPEWAALSGLVGTAVEPSADPDGDGVSNLVEYEFGGIPTIADEESSRLTLEVIPIRGEDHCCLIYHQRIAPNLSYRVEWSLDLVHWSDALEAPQFFQEVLGEVDGVVTIRACIPVGARPEGFLRVVVGG